MKQRLQPDRVRQSGQAIKAAVSAGATLMEAQVLSVPANGFCSVMLDDDVVSIRTLEYVRPGWMVWIAYQDPQRALVLGRLYEDWEEFTPVWDGQTNLTVSGRYLYVPGGIHIQADATWTGSSGSSGYVRMNLNDSLGITASTSGPRSLGSCQLNDVSSSQGEYSGTCRLTPNGEDLQPWIARTGVGTSTQGHIYPNLNDPFTFATGDYWAIDMIVRL